MTTTTSSNVTLTAPTPLWLLMARHFGYDAGTLYAKLHPGLSPEEQRQAALACATTFSTSLYGDAFVAGWHTGYLYGQTISGEPRLICPCCGETGLPFSRTEMLVAESNTDGIMELVCHPLCIVCVAVEQDECYRIREERRRTDTMSRSAQVIESLRHTAAPGPLLLTVQVNAAYSILPLIEYLESVFSDTQSSISDHSITFHLYEVSTEQIVALARLVGRHHLVKVLLQSQERDA